MSLSSPTEGLKDVDLDGSTLRVNRSVYEGVVNPPKTNAGRRTIRLSKLAVSALKQHRVNAATRSEHISEWVFPNAKRTTIGHQNLHDSSWKPLLKRAGLPHSVRFHDLRHSCISLLLAKGVPVKVVSEMAGHADISVTLSVYGHVLPDMQDTAQPMGWTPHSEDRLRRTTRPRNDHGGYSEGIGYPPNV